MFIQVGIPCNWTNDSKHFLLGHFDIIHDSPSHIYHCALPLSPSSSLLRQYYSAEFSLKVVVKGLLAGWGACSHTVSLDDEIWALSYWNNVIAAVCQVDIIILDAITGGQMAVLSGHTGSVMSVAFSSDGRSLVSGSYDNTIKLWDMQTGGVVKTFCGHTEGVGIVSISADSTRIVSGSIDGTINLWDVQTEECLWTTTQQHKECHISFSLIDPQHTISTFDTNVLQWDVNGHQILSTYHGTYIAFSPDHTQFALCNQEGVTVQKSDSRAIMAEIHVDSDWTHHCCFSPDGKLVAAAAFGTAYVWEITSPYPHLIDTFVSHTGGIRSLVFSSPSTLISASADKSVKFWQIGSLSPDEAVTSLQPTLLSSASIQFVSLQARAGIAISGDTDKVVRIWDLSTGLCKASFNTSAASPQLVEADVKLIDDRLILIWYTGGSIEVWDIGKEEHLKSLIPYEEGEDPWSRGVRISGDGSKIFHLGGVYVKAWSMWTWELVGKGKVELGGEHYLDSLCMDNSRVWILSRSSSAQQGWDFGVSGSSSVPFDPSTGRPHLDFIGGPSLWTSDSCWIKDTVTGKNVFQLSGGYVKPNDVQWDGQYLVAGYQSGEVLILDFNDVYSQ